MSQENHNKQRHHSAARSYVFKCNTRLCGWSPRSKSEGLFENEFTRLKHICFTLHFVIYMNLLPFNSTFHGLGPLVVKRRNYRSPLVYTVYLYFVYLLFLSFFHYFHFDSPLFTFLKHDEEIWTENIVNQLIWDTEMCSYGMMSHMMSHEQLSTVNLTCCLLHDTDLCLFLCHFNCFHHVGPCDICHIAQTLKEMKVVWKQDETVLNVSENKKPVLKTDTDGFSQSGCSNTTSVTTIQTIVQVVTTVLLHKCSVAAVSLEEEKSRHVQKMIWAKIKTHKQQLTIDAKNEETLDLEWHKSMGHIYFCF